MRFPMTPLPRSRRNSDNRSFPYFLLAGWLLAFGSVPEVSAADLTSTNLTRGSMRPSPVLRSAVPVRAQRIDSVTIRERFRLGSESAARAVYEFRWSQAGIVRIRATWKNADTPLALILNGPGQESYYARKDGPSPLDLEFKLDPDKLTRGEEWKVSLVRFVGQAPVQGVLTVEHPTPVYKLQDTARLYPTLNLKGVPVNQPQPKETQRTILADGTVEIRYSDGTIKRLFNGGFTLIRPGGLASTVLYAQAQPPTPPDLPANPEAQQWLDQHKASLLEFIRILVGEDAQAVTYYLQQESEKAGNIYDQIYFRTRMINMLLTPK